jgi:competence protein ComEC
MPLFWICLALLCGILLAPRLSIPIFGWLLLAGMAIIILLPPLYHRIFSPNSPRNQIAKTLRIPTPAIYPLMLVFFSVGVIRYQLAQPAIDPSFIAYYNDQAAKYTIEGVVIEPPDQRDSYTNLRISTHQLQLSDTSQIIPIHGLIMARISPDNTFAYGDAIQLTGQITTPTENEDFSYRDYLANQGIYSYMAYPVTNLIQHGMGNPIYSALYAFRQKALSLIYSLFPDPEASLLAGILLGVESGISPQVQDAFRLTGTSHIIVISGFNITIIAGLFIFLFSRFLGRYKGAVAATIGIIVYTLLVGANAAVVRAAILGLLTLLGHLIGRRQAGLNSLTFVAGVMAMITPTVLWDVSFQLSFAATLGIMLYAEPLANWFIKNATRFLSQKKAEKLAGPISEYFLITLAAQLTTLPLMVYYFKRISLTSLIANPLILPAQPAVMILGGLAVLTGLIIRPIGQLFAWVAWPFTAYTIRVVEWLSNIPHGSIALGQVTLGLILLFYAMLFALTFAWTRIKTISARLMPAIPLGVLVVVAVLTWNTAFYAPDGRLHVTILDVGTGEAVLIQSPAGRSVLINGGPSSLQLSDGLGRRLPVLNRSLDWLVVADIDDEDLGGIQANLERFPPSNVLWAGNTFGTRTVRELWSALESAPIPITHMQSGQELDLGAGANLSVFSVDNRGAVLLLEWVIFACYCLWAWISMPWNFSNIVRLCATFRLCCLLNQATHRSIRRN